MTNVEITIIFVLIIFVLIILIIPWYIKQMGRFWCKGIIEYFEEKIQKLKRRKNGKKEKR